MSNSSGAGSERGGATLVSELALARAVRALITSLPGVAALSRGRFADAATYGPGEVIHGVVVSRAAGPLRLEIHLAARYSDSLVLPALADCVRGAVRQAVQTLGNEAIGRIDVAIDELCVEESPGG